MMNDFSVLPGPPTSGSTHVLSQVTQTIGVAIKKGNTALETAMLRKGLSAYADAIGARRRA
jgi:hypothetical protein